jgi:hypothetical protein
MSFIPSADEATQDQFVIGALVGVQLCAQHCDVKPASSRMGRDFPVDFNGSVFVGFQP